MKISFVTSVEDFEGHGGGNQRSKCFIDALTKISQPKHSLEIVVIPFSTFDELDIDDVTNQYMANDIEFSMRLAWALKTGEKKAGDLISKIKDSDFIVLDNCYHFPLIEALEKYPLYSPKLVYLSHNHESRLKSEIADSLNWETDSKLRYLKYIREKEILVWTMADFRIVCSEEDANSLNQALELPIKSHLIPNGANKKIRAVSEPETYLAAMGFESYVLFVSSGHPPNVKGFMDMLGPDFGFIPPKSRLVIVGTSGPIIRELFKGTKYWETFRHRVTILDQATENELQNLYTHCAAVLLPIRQGSGTSIKAIEAILTGKKIIGTEFAFRGLPREIYNVPQVSMVSIPEEFKIEVIKSLSNGTIDFEPHRIASSFLWSSLTRQASELLEKVMQTSRG